MSKQPGPGESRSRTGCITCKARRIKCDETLPSCKRCLKAGRECGGYAPIEKTRRDINRKGSFIIVKFVPSPWIPSTSPTSDRQERRSVDYFRSRAALELAGCFSPDFWSQDVMQILHYEPAVLHAVIALSALHETLTQSVSCHATQPRFALRQYGIALASIRRFSVADHSRSNHVVLVSCVLFTTFESLRGHYRSALMHTIHGVRLFEEATKSHSNASASYLSPRSVNSIFIRLDNQAREIGDPDLRPSGSLRGDFHSLPSTFQTTEEVNECLDFLLNRLTRFAQTPKFQNSKDVCSHLETEYSNLRNYYQQWCSKFDQFLTVAEQSSLSFSKSEPARIFGRSGLIIRIWRTLIGIFLHVDQSKGEMAWDDFIDDFQTIVEDIRDFLDPSSFQPDTGSSCHSSVEPENIKMRREKQDLACVRIEQERPFSPSGRKKRLQDTNHSSLSSRLHTRHQDDGKTSSASTPTFSLSLGVVVPLYVTCKNCRDPSIRREALSLLASCNRKDGIWDSSLVAKVAAHIISIENHLALDLVSKTSQADLFDIPMHAIPDIARVRGVRTIFEADRKAVVKYWRSTSPIRSTIYDSCQADYEHTITW